jgi:hypothetical protein
MNVTVLYVSWPATVVGALSQLADPGASASPSDLAGSSFPFRAGGPVVSIPVGLLGVASIDPTGTDGVFDNPGDYVVALGADNKPNGKLTGATNPHPGTISTLSRTTGITITGTGIPAGVHAVAVLQDTTSSAAPIFVIGTTTAGHFQASTTLAHGPWNVAWFIAGSRPGTDIGHVAT